MFVCEIVGDQMVDAYSRMGRVIALYVSVMVSFCLPQLVEVSACRMLSVFCALLHVSWMCLVKVYCVSRLRPKILLLFVVSSVESCILRLSLFLCSCESGVKSVTCGLLGLMLSLFCLVH